MSDIQDPQRRAIFGAVAGVASGRLLSRSLISGAQAARQRAMAIFFKPHSSQLLTLKTWRDMMFRS